MTTTELYKNDGNFVVSHLLVLASKSAPIPVMLFEGGLYTRKEWDLADSCDYTHHIDTDTGEYWIEFQGEQMDVSNWEFFDASDAETPQEKVLVTNSLKELCDVLLLLEAECREEGCKLEGKVDTTALPSFGGDEPEDTVGVFSWDEENLLTCESIWKIVPREEQEYEVGHE